MKYVALVTVLVVAVLVAYVANVAYEEVTGQSFLRPALIAVGVAIVGGALAIRVVRAVAGP